MISYRNACPSRDVEPGAPHIFRGSVCLFCSARMTCLRCNGTRKERKRPNMAARACYWCQGSGLEPLR
jgi:hypothetical protein